MNNTNPCEVADEARKEIELLFNELFTDQIVPKLPKDNSSDISKILDVLKTILSTYLPETKNALTTLCEKQSILDTLAAKTDIGMLQETITKESSATEGHFSEFRENVISTLASKIDFEKMYGELAQTKSLSETQFSKLKESLTQIIGTVTEALSSGQQAQLEEVRLIKKQLQSNFRFLIVAGIIQTGALILLIYHFF